VRYLVLLGFFLLPWDPWFGLHTDLAKQCFLVIASFFLVDFRSAYRDGGLLLKLGVAVLLISAYSTATSVCTTLFQGFVGEPIRVEGWLTLATIWIFAWLCFWKIKPIEHDEDGNEVSPDRPFELYAWTLVALLLSVTGLYCLSRWYFEQDSGWNLVEAVFSVKMGVCHLAALVAPYLLAWALDSKFKGDLLDRSFTSLRWVFALGTMIWAFTVIGLHGVRSSLLALLLGCAFVVYLHYSAKSMMTTIQRARIVFAIFVAMALLFGVALSFSPTLRYKLKHYSFSSVGSGPRSELAKQAYAHGIFPFGWGVDSQRALIDREGSDVKRGWQALAGGDMAIYDRFHSWPIELLVTIGWVGFGICLYSIALIRNWVNIRVRHWYVRGFAGVLVAFLICSTWNPLGGLFMMLAAIAASGIVAAPATHGESRFSVRGWFSNALKYGTFAVLLVSLGIYAKMLAGDMMMKHAKDRWRAKDGMVHDILGQMAMAQRLDPWRRQEYVKLYYLVSKTGNIKETNGDKLILLYQLDVRPRDYASESLLWLRHKNFRKCEWAFLAALQEGNLYLKPGGFELEHQ